MASIIVPVLFLLHTIMRNFTRRPVTNLMNLLGLTVSLTLVIILSLYCYGELTTDNYHKNGDRVFLYRLEDRIYTPGVLKNEIDSKIPVIESTVRIGGSWEPPVFQVNDKEPIISDLVFADEDFFRLFTYAFIEGNAETALTEPLTIVITRTLSQKLFGKETALGKTIKLNNDRDLVVSAVIEEPKSNSCLNISAITNISTRKIVMANDDEYTNWGWSDFQTFLFLRKGINPDVAGKAILSLFPAEMQQDFQKAKLTPLKKIYFSKFMLLGSNYLVYGDRKKVQILLLVASLVLLVALVNFINISSSQWLEKIKQVGIRKVFGATSSSLMVNTLGESFLLFLAALLVAIILVNAGSSSIKNYVGIDFNQELVNSPGFLFISLLIISILSVAFSIIPALRIASSGAVKNLNKVISTVNARFSFRGFLVTIQFTIAIILISFTILVQKQIGFGSSNLGFSHDNIVSIKLNDQLCRKKDVLKGLLEENSMIRKVSFSQFYPGNTNQFRETQITLFGEKRQVSFDLLSADKEFFEIMGIQLVSGRLYTDDLSSDRNKVVVNEAFLRQNNIANPLEGILNMGTGYEIIGVVKDFHYKPVHQPVAPLAIRNEFNAYSSYCLVSVGTGGSESLTATSNIRKTVSGLSEGFPAEVNFIDDAIRNMYRSELRFRRIFSLFAICAIVICCMGILAMTIFASQHRVREIGIRKVNGARIREVMVLLNKDIIKWVAIAFVISAPIGLYAMQKWLNNFAYKTGLSWWIFALAALITLVITFLTVSRQSLKAAKCNPVDALRYE